FKRRTVGQLLYGTALLTAVSVTPSVTLELHLSYSKESPAAVFRYPNVLIPALVSLALTTLAMLPFLLKPKRWRRQKRYYLPLLPWIIVCCLKFHINVELFFKGICHLWDGGHPEALIFALGVYCAISSLALAQMLRWNVMYHLMTNDI
ncbi:hypothetical protein KR084_012038, partial [Drosophila pseudotakahashii]